MRPPRLLVRLVFVLMLAAGVGAAAPVAWGGPPAALSSSRARTSFHRFARSWMAKMRRAAAESRARPTIRRSARGPVASYRAVGKEFRTELKPTGHPSVPYVGLLHYTEHVYACSDARARVCRVASTNPVVEIFRFQNGRWIY